MSKKGVYYNIPDKYKYSVAFENVKIKPLVSEEQDKYLSLASAANLKKFLPKDLPDENIGLLAWAGNFCVANKVNLNSDCISTTEALYVSDLLPYTYVDLEHNKGTILCVILTAGFSEYGTDKPLTRDEVKDYKKPFNITAGGVIWRIINPDFADEVEKMGQPDSKESISLSWEIAFNDSNLILIDKDKTNLEDGRIISDAAEISRLENNLQSFGGTGFVEGKRIARLIINEPLPLGAGFVSNPAGQVGKIATAATSKASMICPECGEEIEMEDDMDDEEEHSCAKCGKKSMGKNWKSKANKQINILENLSGMSPQEAVETLTTALKAFSDGNNKNSEISSSQLKNTDVKESKSNINIKKTMIKTIKDVTEESLKEATASEIIKAHKIDLDAEVTKISQEWEEKKNKVENELKASKEAQEKTQKELTEATEKLAKVEEDLNKLAKAAEAKEQEETFNARMNYFNSEYDLDEKSRNAVANRIKSLDEEAYKQEKEDLEVLLAAKKKGFVPFKKKGEKEVEDSEEDKKEDKKEKEAKASAEGEKKTETTVDDAIDKGTKVPATVAATATVTETQTQKFAKAFGKDSWVLHPNVRK